MIQIEKTTPGQKLLGSEKLSVNLSMFESTARAALSSKNFNDGNCYALKDLLTDIAIDTPIEGMLVSQMIALHSHAMALLAAAHNTLSVETKEQYLNLSSKLIRGFNASLEVLGKYKRQGTQTIRVENVTIGQAVVGNAIQNLKKGVFKKCHKTNQPKNASVAGNPETKTPLHTASIRKEEKRGSSR